MFCLLINKNKNEEEKVFDKWQIIFVLKYDFGHTCIVFLIYFLFLFQTNKQTNKQKETDKIIFSNAFLNSPFQYFFVLNINRANISTKKVTLAPFGVRECERNVNIFEKHRLFCLFFMFWGHVEECLLQTYVVYMEKMSAVKMAHSNVKHNKAKYPFFVLFWRKLFNFGV